MAAAASGAEIRTESMAAEVLLNADGRARGVRYFRTTDRGSVEEEQRARAVIVAGYAIETPRRRLNSVSPTLPNGLASSSGLVGKNLMAQAGPVVWGVFDEMIRQYKAPPS